MTVAEEIQVANEAYVKSWTKGQLPLPPARKVAIVTCMDARILPASAFGLKEGDAHVIRNAGGRTDASHIDFLPFSKLEQNVREDVAFLRNSPLIPKSVNIYGYVFDVATGRLVPVDSEQ
ncbi:hypothetical protein BGZ80_003176 [Entomortierella chlamydospora]|uniref:Carbonic anhydrase n=1 Tax=Entomortierella chlamydospora TaxID=101097 RepID=A0A9P6SWM5_9FUNG|nr:hypothetical protein BGZ80_003176 [Entomortierella chlamydospora]